jgi:hypothetical protein
MGTPAVGAPGTGVIVDFDPRRLDCRIQTARSITACVGYVETDHTPGERSYNGGSVRQQLKTVPGAK